MKVQLLLLLALCSQTAALAGTHYDDFSGSKSEHFGINYPEILDSGGISTQTTHHRWGNQTGIGSSTSQTQSATAGSMPTVRYRPTSVSPALHTMTGGNGMQRLDIFSQRMSSPALAPAETTFSGFGSTVDQSFFPRSVQSTTGFDSRFMQSQTGLDSIAIPVGGRHQARGGGIGRELSDPFKGL